MGQELQIAPGGGYRSTSELPVAKSFDALEQRQRPAKSQRTVTEPRGTSAEKSRKTAPKPAAQEPQPATVAPKPARPTAKPAKKAAAKASPKRRTTLHPPAPRRKPVIPRTWQAQPERQIIEAAEGDPVVQVVDDISPSNHREFDDSSRR